MRRAVLFCLALSTATVASAATFTVTNLSDADPGSLRDAIAQANANPGADTIAFGVTGTITLTSGQILITEALTIQGPGATQLTIDGSANNRIFAVVEQSAPACPSLTGPADYPVSMSGLKLRNGRRNVANSSGGAIIAFKSLSLEGMVFENNHAKSGGAVSFLAQHPGQTLTIANSQFTNNEAREIIAGSTGTHVGGAILASENCTGTRTTPSTITITDSLFDGNIVRASAINARGGAIGMFNDADVTIARSRIVGNRSLPPNPTTSANAQGGGLAVRAGSLIVRDSEIADNESDVGAGVSLYNEIAARQTFQDRMVALVVNTTISNNRAYSSPAGIYAFANVDVRLHNSTVVGNRSDLFQTGGVTFNTGATNPPTASNALPPTLTLASSVLWNTLAIRDIAKNSANMPGALVVQSDNSLVGQLCDSTCGPGLISLSGAGNLQGVDPLLGELGFNGGLMRTRVPQLGSPVIGTGNNVLALTEDQRGAGFPRTIGAVTDMGAAEYAYAAQCDGFLDVAGDGPFCPSVSWMKNRNVTTGCGGGNYCPSPDVSRLAMAAFMKRLGDALSGQPIVKEAAPGALDFATAPVVCQTDPIPAASAPRRAALDAVFAGLAGADSLGRASLVASTDGGATWATIALYTMRSTFRTNLWHSVHLNWFYDVEATKSVRFGLMMDRTDAAPSGVTDSRCRLRVRMQNSSGFTPS